MKKFKYLLPIISLSFLALRCEKITELQPGVVNINIKATYNSQPFVMNKVYDYNGKKVRFSRFQFFITNGYTVRIVNNSPLEQFATIANFTMLDDSLKASKGIDVAVKNIKVCNCQFFIGLGVDTLMNKRKPNEYGAGHALADADNYWDSWNSYIFSKLEGSMDKDGDGRFETGITLHTGGNSTFRTSNAYFIDFDGNNAAKLSFKINMNDLLKGIDLTTINSTHQTGDLPTMIKFMDNLKEVLK
jgi:hypothetical protein